MHHVAERKLRPVGGEELEILAADEEMDHGAEAGRLDEVDARRRPLPSLKVTRSGLAPTVTAAPSARPAGRATLAMATAPTSSVMTSPSARAVASRKFIAGEPMKPATKMLAGSS